MLIRYLIGLICLGSLAAEEFQPIPTSPEEQLRIFHELAAKVGYSVYDLDEAGNITFVGFVHGGKRGRSSRPPERIVNNRDQKDELPGIHDEDFHRIRHFPELRGISIIRLPLTDRGYEVLTAFPKLEIASLADLRTGWPKDYEGPRPTDAVFRHLDGARGLKAWNTTHSFGLSNDEETRTLSRLQGFPELSTLIVDNGHADDFEELYPFLQKCPNIEYLKLHRCPFTEEQYVQILDALPNLKRLEIKPAKNTPGEHWSYRSLRLLRKYPNIVSFELVHPLGLPLPWEDGLEHLVDTPNLRYFQFPTTDDEPGRADLRKLMEARPDLQILSLPEELWPDGIDQREWRKRRNQLLDEVNELHAVPNDAWIVGPAA